MKKLSILILFFVLFTGSYYSQITVQDTIPQVIKISDVNEFVINVANKTIEVNLKDGRHASLTRVQFLAFWDNTMSPSNRVVVMAFVKQLTTIAFNVDPSKVTGDL